MGRTLDEVIAALPEERQVAIRSRADEKVEEMLREASTLGGIRKALGKTQAKVAESLGVKQNAVSQLEKRQDIYLSTFKKFLKSMGMDLEMVVVAKGGERYSLSNFDPAQEFEEVSASTNDDEVSLVQRAKRPRKGGKKAASHIGTRSQTVVTKPGAKRLSAAKHTR